MTDHVEHVSSASGFLNNKTLWLFVGLACFVTVGFILPIPSSLIQVVQEKGFAQQMIQWGIAENVQEAARKAMIVLGIIPMAIIFFATEAIPIGLTGILMPVLAYFLHCSPVR